MNDGPPFHHSIQDVETKYLTCYSNFRDTINALLAASLVAWIFNWEWILRATFPHDSYKIFGDHSSSLVFAAVLIAICIVYLTESFTNGCFALVKNRMTPADAIERLNECKGKYPKFILKVSCYHNIIATSNNGSLSTSTVDTFSDKREFGYNICVDSSEFPEPYVSFDEITRIHIVPDLFFADDQTLYSYEKAKHSLIDQNRFRDSHYRYEESLTVPETCQWILVVPTNAGIIGKLLVSSDLYFLSVMTLTNWIFRIGLRTSARYVAYRLRKTISVQLPGEREKWIEGVGYEVPLSDISFQYMTFNAP